jgi:hypothetical protein
VRSIVVTPQDKELILRRLPAEIRDVVALADNIFDSEEVVSRMVEKKMPGSVVYCRSVVQGRLRLVPYFRLNSIAERLKYSMENLRIARKNISKELRFPYSKLVNVTGSNRAGNIPPNTTFTTYKGVLQLLITTTHEDEAKDLELIIDSIYELTRDIVETLYEWMLKYQSMQKDVKISELNTKMDTLLLENREQTIQMREQTERMKEQDVKINQLLKYGKLADEKLTKLEPRVIVPAPKKCQEEMFILLHLHDNIYYVIRAQEKAAKQSMVDQRAIHPNLRVVLTMKNNSNSVLMCAAVKDGLKLAGNEVVYNTITLSDDYDEESLVDYIKVVYRRRLD